MSNIENPSHYTSHPSGVECITITKHFNFCLGNAIKYIWRAGKKGSHIEDLKKAREYLNIEIATLEANQKPLIEVKFGDFNPVGALSEKKPVENKEPFEVEFLKFIFGEEETTASLKKIRKEMASNERS